MAVATAAAEIRPKPEAVEEAAIAAVVPKAVVAAIAVVPKAAVAIAAAVVAVKGNAEPELLSPSP